MPTPRITVVFLLYNAAPTVAALAVALAKQRHPEIPNQADWLEAIFMDDASTDDTLAVLAKTLDAHGRPANWRVETNPQNLGLARTVNRAFGLAGAPFVLTCHCDCFFAEENYVAGMLALMERTPDAGAITGQAVVPRRALVLAEKVNIVAQLMDIFPASGSDLVPVGFAEGRCDCFRKEAVERAGYYDTSFRTCGEDQVLASRMRANGSQVYQAPRLAYELSVSGEQDSLRKLARHMTLFGRIHPLLVLTERGTHSGAWGFAAGGNRRARTMLRVAQISAVAALAWIPIALALMLPVWTAIAPLLLVLLAKLWLFRRHIAAVRFTAGELLLVQLWGIVFDLSYVRGLFQGLWMVATGWRRQPASAART